jgi:hypothetical protein
MTTKTNSTKVIRRVFVCDSNTIGKLGRTFNALDAVIPSTRGLQGVRASTTGLAARKGAGAVAARPIKETSAQGFKAGPGGVAGNRQTAKGPSAADIEKIKRDAQAKGVADYNASRERDQQNAMDNFISDYIAAKPLGDEALRALIGG